MAKVTILGAGMMGSAIAVPLGDRGHEVRLVGTHLDGAIVDALRDGKPHPGLGVPLGDRVRAHAVDEAEAALAGAELVVVGVSSPGVVWAGRTLAGRVPPGAPVVMITKGLSWDGTALRFLPDLLADALGPSVLSPGAVAGPCIAGELARRVETCVVITGRDRVALEAAAHLLRTPYYHVRVSTDLAGNETCAALKNAYAMAVGFAAGLHEARGGAVGSIAMHNYEAAVFAQASLEMRRLTALLGGTDASAAGLAGVGDLNVTCNGGRTGRFGRLLGTGLSVTGAVAAMKGATLECVDILRTLREGQPFLRARGLGEHELPLLRHMQAVVFDGAPVRVPFADFFADET